MGIYEFNGKKYEQASRHQKEWGQKVFSDLHLNGNESILDSGLRGLVPDGTVVHAGARRQCYWNRCFNRNDQYCKKT